MTNHPYSGNVDMWISLYTGLKLNYLYETLDLKGNLAYVDECTNCVIHRNPQNVCRLWINGGRNFQEIFMLKNF